MKQLTPGQLLALQYRIKGYRLVEIAQMMHSTRDTIHFLLNRAYRGLDLQLNAHDLRFTREVKIKNAFNEYSKKFKVNSS